ncbi:trigger factor-related chaperone [Mycoplasmopsis verecunda]|uniref:Trigger factor n=1 Tax=Mycoplasmopsis verecunda TaxID=171291 RepID=A0A1T4M019_9BACT|nr:hypothetical protein [Mycoplasmopsis verecunda]WPB54592.1 hypothetical protein SAM46_00270 [Mycoplasmopsis verecunda]SJZ60245.1 hypothetical protein SAMN02745154_00590 [Mycoplasmopsis verecunda]
MKFETKHIELPKEDWLKAQNDALQFLERNKQQGQKIEQKLIIETAFNNLVEFYRNREMSVNNNTQEDKIYFLPIVSNEKYNIDEVSFDFKTYYQDNLKNFEIDINPNIKFEIPSDFESSVKLFTENFMKSYRFRIPSSKDAVESGDNVEFRIWPVGDETKAEKFTAIANISAENPIEKILVGMKPHETRSVEAYGMKYELELILIFSFQEMPINELNVHLLNIPTIKTLKDVESHIHDVTLEQTVNDSLFSYGEKVMTSILEKNKGKFQLPDDLIQNDLKAFEFSPEFKGDKVQLVSSTIENYFWTILVMKQYNFGINQEDIDSEYQKLSNILPQEEMQKLTGQRLSNIVLFKKLAIRYLEKYQTEDFNKYEKYFKSYLTNE